MRILLSTPRNGDFLEVLGKIESWNYVVVPYDLPGKNSFPGTDFWLGSSRDGMSWALATVPYGIYESFDPVTATVAILLDPPKQNRDSITEILLRIYIAGQNGELLSTDSINSIVAAVTFPEYRTVESYFPEAPQDWLQLPSEIVVGFTLSEGACVVGGTFDEYSRDSIEGVLRVVCGPRHDGILIGYTLATREVIPLLQWDVDWPLARRGKELPTRREKVQGALPWESETDQSLFSIYQHVAGTAVGLAPPYFSKPVVRLRVGGRTRKEAVNNWHTCSKALRALKKHSKKHSLERTLCTAMCAISYC